MRTALTIAICCLLASAALGDFNLETPAPPGSPLLPPRDGVITLFFPGPLHSYHVDLRIVNNSSFDLEMVVIDGSVVTPRAVVWESFGEYTGSPTLVDLVGEGTSIVTATFVDFVPGAYGGFDTLDPDFPNDSNVAVIQLVGTACTVYAGGLSASGVFANDGYSVVATLEPGPILVECRTWGAIKGLFR